MNSVDCSELVRASTMQLPLVTVRGANQTTPRHEVIGGIAVGLRIPHQTLTRDEVVGGLRNGGADRSGDDDESGSGLNDGFYGISLWIGCKHDCLHG
jgi:hypothetical protein